MTTVYYTATTLDGFLADPDDSLDWLFRQKQDDGGPFDYEVFIEKVGALAMGATTYEWVRAHLAGSREPWPYRQPTWVFTHRRLPLIDGADVRFTQDAVDQVHAPRGALRRTVLIGRTRATYPPVRACSNQASVSSPTAGEAALAVLTGKVLLVAGS